MIRHLAWVVFSFLSISISISTSIGQAAEIATVLGKPSQSQVFTQKLIKERIHLVEPSFEDDPSTWVYSILARKGVQSAISIEVVKGNGSVDLNTLIHGLIMGSIKAPVVFSNIGPIDNNICDLLSRQRETAFVVVAGNEGIRLDPIEEPKCLAGNILKVAALDQTTDDLMSFSNWGPIVRIAAPSKGILAIGRNGKPTRSNYNTTAGASLVAGLLAVYKHIHSELKGSELIGSFLEERTIKLPKLKNKIEGERALKDVEL